MKFNNDLTPERVRELLHYNPDTGAFTWASSSKQGHVSKGKPAGRVSANGYHDIGIDGARYRSHRLAWVYMFGMWPQGVIDHMDGNPLNNKIKNLRDVTQKQNMHNIKAARVDSQSGLKGVTRTKTGKYRASIVIGTYDTPEEAKAAYIAAKTSFHAGYVE